MNSYTSVITSFNVPRCFFSPSSPGTGGKIYYVRFCFAREGIDGLLAVGPPMESQDNLFYM